MTRFVPTALMLGNIVIGCSVIAPAGMLPERSGDLGVSVATAGLLITFGAIVLCIGSPLTAWLTSRTDRRSLLTATLLTLALTMSPRPLATVVIWGFGFASTNSISRCGGWVTAFVALALALVMVFLTRPRP